ncbi:GNAT family N-acetyltransferase [Paenibacillus sp. M1]|uniref:GNAT family N-acetyltransferase n=1 Tax=Paenibacillus haidiansis TaxID=1574488 RepID=A0ABU7VQ26_9BACL
MNIQALNGELLERFIDYCRKHRTEVDDSFLYEEDLRDFNIGKENPTYVAVNQHGEIIAAASLIKDAHHARGKKARFRIFHSEIADAGIYKRLLDELLKHGAGLEQFFVFVPVVRTNMIEIVEELHFEVERYSFILVREGASPAPYFLPEGYSLVPFSPGRDEQIWADVRNIGFAKLKGSQTPITAEMVSKMAADDDYIDGGMLILYHHDRPVGIVRGADDEYEGEPIMNIGPLALIPEYQGKGLGRMLLRAALHFAKEKGYNRTILCVNAENERAKALYLQEGFVQMEAAANYRYELGSGNA